MFDAVVRHAVVDLVGKHDEAVAFGHPHQSFKHVPRIHRASRIVRVDNDDRACPRCHQPIDFFRVGNEAVLGATRVVNGTPTIQGDGRRPQGVIGTRDEHFVSVVQQGAKHEVDQLADAVTQEHFFHGHAGDAARLLLHHDGFAGREDALLMAVALGLGEVLDHRQAHGLGGPKAEGLGIADVQHGDFIALPLELMGAAGEPSADLIADVAKTLAGANGGFVFHSQISAPINGQGVRGSPSIAAAGPARARRLSHLPPAMAGDMGAPLRRLPWRSEVPADVDRVRASCAVYAAARRRQRRRRLPKDRPCKTPRLDLRIGHRNRLQKSPRVGVQGALIQTLGRRQFHHPAEVHDEHPVAQSFHDRQIVADEQQRHSMLALQIGQQADHLRLYRHIQSAHRLIANQYPRLENHGPGNSDALALAAAELVGITIGHLGSQPHVPESLQDRSHPIPRL